MSLANELKDVTQGLTDAVEVILEEASAGRAVASALRSYVASKIAAVHELADAMADPEDEPELYRSAAFLWLELKSEWVRYNQTMQYQVARRGEADVTLVLKGATCSAVLARIEPMLLPGDVDVLATMSAEPLAFGKADAERVRRFLAHHDKVMGHLGRIFQAASQSPLPTPLARLEAAEADRLPKRLEDLASRYEQLLDAMLRETHEAMLVPYDLLWASHRQSLEDAGNEAGIRLQIANATSEGTRFDLRFARFAEEIVRCAARALFDLVDTGDVGHANVGLSVTHGERETSFALWSDRVVATWAECASSPARADLLARLDRVRGTAIMADQGDRALVTLTLPRDRATQSDHFLLLPGGALAPCVPACDLEEPNDASAGLPSTVLDLCPTGVAPMRVLRVRLGRDARLDVRCPMPPRHVRGLVLPASIAPDLAAAGFDFAVVSAAGVFGLLEAHVLPRFRLEAPLEAAA